MSTGQRIKERRKQLSISAEILAKKLSVSPATVYRWEKGDIEKVPMNILPTLSDALQTTPQYLMEWTDDPEQPKQFGEESSVILSTLDKKLIDMLAGLSPQKKKLLDLVCQVPDEKAAQLLRIFQSVLEYGEES